MNQLDLLNAILYIIPNAKFSVQDPNTDMQFDEATYLINNWLVVWNSTNTASCPSESTINQVDLELAYQAAEERRKDVRDSLYSEDITVQVGLQIQQQKNSSLTLRQYLDSLGL